MTVDSIVNTTNKPNNVSIPELPVNSSNNNTNTNNTTNNTANNIINSTTNNIMQANIVQTSTDKPNNIDKNIDTNNKSSLNNN